ncbi:hypothetical protein, partial [Phascolarctobacterium succinatutens]|uniref:hypothetical protein n=1 Tax=Phascolarctobacterium succinatutens TaxID=626940 RepID=UPI0023FA3AFA
VRCALKAYRSPNVAELVNDTRFVASVTKREIEKVELSSLATEQGARKRINKTQFVASVAPRETECRIILEEDK